MAILASQIGSQAELVALRYLDDKMFKLVEKNFTAKTGEIDLIMLDKDTLVFIEVRYRKNNHYGDAIATIDSKKQQKIIKTAYLFINKNKKYSNYIYRFDVIGITGSLKYSNIVHLVNAFEIC